MNRDRTLRLWPRPLVPVLLILGAHAAMVQTVSTAPSAADELDRLTDLLPEQSLEVEISGVLKVVHRSPDAPSPVTVLTAEDFKTCDWRTLNNALRNVRRRDCNSRMLLPIDGYRRNDSISDGTQSGIEFPLVMENDVSINLHDTFDRKFYDPVDTEISAGSEIPEQESGTWRLMAMHGFR